MNKGVKLRLKIQNILLDIFKSEKKIDAVYINHKINKFDTRDISFINNVCMNTMRYIFHTKQILNLYRKKKSNIHEEILLCTAITQIVYLDFKDYAVIDSTIEVAKKFKIYHGFVNAILKKISKDKFDLVKIEINFEVLPSWFKKKASYLSNLNKKNIIKTIVQEPDIHIVFKKKEYLYSFEEQIKKSTEVSGF